MPQKMEAEILFLDPDDVDPGCAALRKLGFKTRILDWVDDWVDDYAPTVWITARIATELDQNHFLDWVHDIVEPLHGDVVQGGFQRARAEAVTP